MMPTVGSGSHRLTTLRYRSGMANPFKPIAILRALLTPMIAMGLVSGPASGQSQDSGNSPPPYQAGQMAQPVRDPVIAIVDGRELHLSELGDLIQDLPAGQRTLPFDTLYPALLSDLIDQNALELQARRLRLDQDPAVIRKMRAAAGRVLGQVLLNQIQHDEVTEPAIRRLYADMYGDKATVDEVHIRLIMLGNESDATAALARLRAGEDFAALARQASRDPSSVQGGNLGFLRRSQLQPNVANAVFALAPGEVTPKPVRTPIGWGIIKLEERSSVPPPSLEAAHDELRRLLMQQAIRKAAAAARAEAVVRAFNLDGTPVTATPGDMPQDDVSPKSDD